MRKNWKRVGLVMALSAMLLSSGCWGLILYGRPGPGRNKGKIDWGVVVLDLVFFGLIGLSVDACAGTLRRPEGYPSPWVDNGIKIRAKPADLERNGDRKLVLTWDGDDGTSQELYSGTVRGACEQVIPTKGCAGAGKISVKLDGSTDIAWSTRVPGLKTQLASQ